MSTAELIAAERRALVARLRDLPEEQWSTPSLCGDWTVHQVLAHLTTLLSVSVPAVGLAMVRTRGIGSAMDAVARRLAERPPSELLDVLEAGATSRRHPPGLPLEAPLTDVLVHSADVRWALGDPVQDWGDPQRVRGALGFLTSARAVLGFVPPGRLRGVRLVATDLDWSHGRGTEVRGPALVLAAGVLGRGPALDRLDGALPR